MNGIDGKNTAKLLSMIFPQKEAVGKECLALLKVLKLEIENI
jgi:hypothetical protein